MVVMMQNGEKGGMGQMGRAQALVALHFPVWIGRYLHILARSHATV